MNEKQVHCDDCGEEWPDAPPMNTVWTCDCGSPNNRRLPCADCPLTKAREERQSEAGLMLDHIIGLDFAAESFTVDWNEVSAIDGRAVQILRQERERYRGEQFKKQAPVQKTAVPIGPTRP